MAIVELSHKELTTLNFCLATTEATGEIQNVPSLVEKVKPLRAKIEAVIDNNYNDREVDENEIAEISKEFTLDDDLGEDDDA